MRFHVASLGLGELAVIQVIFVTQLVFILPFARFISKTTITGSDWLGAIVVTVGIAVFVTFAKPEAGTDSASNAKWALAIGVVALLCAIAIFLGYRFTGAARAALLGVSGGLINGLVAPLTKGQLRVRTVGWRPVWQLADLRDPDRCIAWCAVPAYGVPGRSHYGVIPSRHVAESDCGDDPGGLPLR